jgi:uncharacterized protein
MLGGTGGRYGRQARPPSALTEVESVAMTGAVAESAERERHAGSGARSGSGATLATRRTRSRSRTCGLPSDRPATTTQRGCSGCRVIIHHERRGCLMAGEQNVEAAKRAYAAFSAGDAAGAMSNIDDEVEWITPGDSAISGTLRSKQEVGALWAKLAEKGFTTSPQYWFSDNERVVVLTQVTVGGEQADSVDVLTYRDGRLVKFQTAGDTALFERVFGSK